jgi:transposase
MSTTKARFTFGPVVLTSKLIDGTFPDYTRVIPTGNDKRLTVDCGPFAAAVDRVSTISSERGRAVKLALSEGKLTLSVTNPDSGSATEELEVDYDAAPIDIGFNARYLLDITGQLDSDTALFKLADPGSPTVIQDRDGAALVLDKIRQRFNWLELVWADGGYNARQVIEAVAKQPSLRIEIVKRSDDMKGFVVLPRRWVVERTFSWFGRNRRLATAWLYAASNGASCRSGR